MLFGDHSLEQDSRPSRLYVALELAAFLGSFALPGLVSWAYKLPKPPYFLDSAGGALYEVALKLARAGLLIFILYASREGLKRFGFRVPSKSDAVAIAVLVAGTAAIIGGYHFLAGRGDSSGDGSGFGSPWYVVAALVVVPIYEELFFRSYLMTRVRDLTGSWPAAVAVSSVIFAAAHRYEGAAALIQNGAFGLLLAICYWRWRRLLPLAIVHMAYDLIWLFTWR